MAVEEEVRPRRRIRVVQRLDRELAEEALRGSGLVGRLERLPVRLGLHVARDHVVDGQREQVEHDDHEQRERHRRRVGHAARGGGSTRAISQAPGSAKSAYQATPLKRWLLEWWPSSCASTVFTSSSVKLPSRSVFQKHDPLARAEADGVGVRGVREVGDVLDAERHRVDPLLRRVRAAGGLQVGAPQRLRRRQVRIDELEEERQSRRRPARRRATSGAGSVPRAPSPRPARSR